MTESDHESQSSIKPIWPRIFCALGILVVIATGICIATVPGWEVRHATGTPGTGLILHGATAVVVGICVVIWGLIFMTFLIYPDSKIWTEPFGSRRHVLDKEAGIAKMDSEKMDSEEC